MQPEMIASLPLWLAALLLVGGAIGGALLIELLVRRVISLDVRTSHNDVAAAMLGVVGTTYAVLLAFVAMLAWDGYNKAQSVTDTEASLVLNVYQLVDGLSGPDMVSMQSDIVAYAHAVVEVEWPAQAAGRLVTETQPSMARLMQTALHLRPGNFADSNLHTLLLGDLERLSSTRRERLLVHHTPLPTLVWFVLVAGGAISVVFASFLGAPSLGMHMALSSMLALSGALVLLLIVALSNPFRGDLAVSVDPFKRVLAQIAPAAKP